MTTHGYRWLAVGVVVVLVALIAIANYAASYDAPRPGYSAVCQTGGPIEGDSGTCGVLPSGSGKQMIGYENNLIEFPAQQRFWRIAPIDAADVQDVTLPTSNGNIVSPDAQVRFILNQDEKVLLDFYKKYATRTYGGPSATDDPDKWWISWLNAQFHPLVENALREEIGKYTCAELNPSCDLTKLNADLEKLANDKTAAAAPAQSSTEGRQANQKLSEIGAAVTKTLRKQLPIELRGDFLTQLNVKVNKVNPSAAVIDEINSANGALARLVRDKADARGKFVRAEGDANARKAQADGVRALNQAYANAPEKAQVDMWRAICGADGCPIETLSGQGLSILQQRGK